MKDLVIIGYSGHAYVCIEAAISQGRQVKSYFDREHKITNPYHLEYLGPESEIKDFDIFQDNLWFVAIGNNDIRTRVQTSLETKIKVPPTNVVHTSATLANKITLGNGILIGPGVIINPLVQLGNGVICNSGCIIEHECIIGDFAHICPGAVLAGNVQIGANSFVGANSVVKQGITIGNNVTIGAGSVVVKDVPDDITVFGNPARRH